MRIVGVVTGRMHCNGRDAYMMTLGMQRTRPLTVGVAESERGRGIGTLLLEHLCAHMCRTFVLLRSISLHVLTENRVAIGLYEKHGFEIVATYPTYYRISSSVRSAYLMERRVMKRSWSRILRRLLSRSSLEHV